MNLHDMLAHGCTVAGVGSDDGATYCATWDGTAGIPWWLYPTAGSD